MSDNRQELITTLEKKTHVVRRTIMEMIAIAGHGHPGGALSLVEIITVLYYYVLNIDPTRPNWENRDRFILSKGHGSAALYAILATRGFFNKKEFESFRQTGGILQGHPDMRKTPGVDMSTGSLGQGLSAALGMALAARCLNKNQRVYSLIGDGESQEGQIWEAAMAASHFRVDNLTAILDYNKVQLDGNVTDIMSLEPIKEKWKAFGWKTIVCSDGHSLPQLINTFDEAKTIKGKPVIIICHTVKGKGISFMENQADWHGVSDPDRLPSALHEINHL